MQAAALTQALPDSLLQAIKSGDWVTVQNFFQTLPPADLTGTVHAVLHLAVEHDSVGQISDWLFNQHSQSISNDVYVQIILHAIQHATPTMLECLLGQRIYGKRDSKGQYSTEIGNILDCLSKRSHEEIALFMNCKLKQVPPKTVISYLSENDNLLGVHYSARNLIKMIDKVNENRVSVMLNLHCLLRQNGVVNDLFQCIVAQACPPGIPTIWTAAKYGDVQAVKRFLRDPPEPMKPWHNPVHNRISYAFREAAKHGHVDVVIALSPYVPYVPEYPLDTQRAAFYEAVERGHIEITQLLYIPSYNYCDAHQYQWQWSINTVSKNITEIIQNTLLRDKQAARVLSRKQIAIIHLFEEFYKNLSREHCPHLHITIFDNHRYSLLVNMYLCLIPATPHRKKFHEKTIARSLQHSLQVFEQFLIRPEDTATLKLEQHIAQLAASEATLIDTIDPLLLDISSILLMIAGALVTITGIALMMLGLPTGLSVPVGGSVTGLGLFAIAGGAWGWSRRVSQEEKEALYTQYKINDPSC